MPVRWLPVRKPWNRPWKISHSLTNPFSGGSAAMPSVPTKAITDERGRRWTSPPSRSMSLVPGRVLGDAGLEEQQGLVAAVVRHMVDPGDQQERPQRLLAAGVEDHGGAERGHDDAGVLDRGVGEEPLDVAFGHRVQDADRRGHRPAAHGDQAGPGAGGRSEPEREQRDAVDAQLDDHAGQERRPVGGRDRVRLGQPHVQRDQARLEPEAGQRQQEGGGPPPARHGRGVRGDPGQRT